MNPTANSTTDPTANPIANSTPSATAQTLASPTPKALSPINFAQLDCRVSLPLLQSEVAQLLGASWVDHVNTNDYCGGWNLLPLRCQAQHRHSHPLLQGFAIAEGDFWEDLPAMASCAQIQYLLAQLQCPVKSVRLMRLCAGAIIKPHRDLGLGLAFGEARLHMPVFSSSAIRFWVKETLIPMAEGELWYFNADEIHAVENPGDADRINLVIDCVGNEWLNEQVLNGVRLG